MKRWLDFIFGIPLTWVLSLLGPGFRRDDVAGVREKILVIKLAAAGDTILLGPVLRSFRKAHPDAEIHWLVSPINAALARLNPSVDKIIVWAGRLGSLLPLAFALRREKYDAVCDLEQWSRGTTVLAFLSGAPRRTGFDTPGQHRTALFTDSYPKRYQQHEIDEFYGVLSLLGPMESDRRFDLRPSAEGEADRDRLATFPDNKLRVLIHPGCGADGTPREWPLAQYAVLAHWLIKKHNAEIYISSGPEESKKALQLNRLLNGAVQDMGGKLSWNGVIALIERMDLVISGNTGVMHLAAALGKKQVALHGPTNPLLWGPINANARVIQSSCPKCPCLKLGFEYHANDASCMQKIDVEEVKSVVGQLIDNNRGI